MATTMVRKDPEHQRGQGTQWRDDPGTQHLGQKHNPMQTTLRKLTAAWPLVILLLLPGLTHAETAVQAWVQRYNGPANGNDRAYAVAVDSCNSVIVTGCAPGSGGTAITGRSSIRARAYRSGPTVTRGAQWHWERLRHGGGPQRRRGACWGGWNGSSSDFLTIKYSSAGALLWSSLYNGEGNGEDHAFAVAVDGKNAVLVTGYSIGSGTHEDYLTIKYSSTGIPLWTNRYNGPPNSNDRATTLAVDGSDDVIVTGYSYGTIAYLERDDQIFERGCAALDQLL